MRTTAQIINSVPPRICEQLPTPPYHYEPARKTRIGLAVESMKRHMTNEGWEIFDGLKRNGWQLSGYGIDARVNVREIEAEFSPSTILLQDKREWEGLTAGGFKGQFPERFTDVESLKSKPNVFKLTILKDAQGRLDYHRHSADEIDAHAWVVYYHPKVVKHLSPFVREEHLVRTYHTIDAASVPDFKTSGRDNCLLSGAVSNAYPLRRRLWRDARQFGWHVLNHPGYHRNGSLTPIYLAGLNKYKVAVCTSSVFGYALRKIIEATACGCKVITDLPVDEVLPEIDGNLIRVDMGNSNREIASLVKDACAKWDVGEQVQWASTAKLRYSHTFETRRLSAEIESLRLVYKGASS